VAGGWPDYSVKKGENSVGTVDSQYIRNSIDTRLCGFPLINEE
jgi:hypothetical protein